MSESSDKLIVCVCGTEIPFSTSSSAVCPSCGRPLETAPSTLLAPTVAAPDETVPEPVQDVHSLEWKTGDIILGRYAVLGQVGEGGMGHVYRVKHLGWHMDLAVKSPKSKILRRRRGVENFERECETWVNLGLHPHIVTCYYVRRVGGIPRVFAEYVPGGSVWERIQSGKLYGDNAEEATGRILDVAIQFAWGLQYAHDQGLVHQDVKPGNVLMKDDGHVKVTDFGLARVAEGLNEEKEGESDPATGVKFAGMTKAYCSPEQARSDTLTPKSDMWGWAVSVLEMFCRRVTWPSGEAAPMVLEKAARGKYAHPDHVRIPDGVISLLRYCFQPSLDQRPAHMGDVASELKAIYASTCGQTYPRPEPRMTEALADGLNNRAVSLMDLGRGEQAQAVWSQALRADPHHPASTFNSGLFKWRDGELADDVFRQRLTDVHRFHPGDPLPKYLLGQFYLEQGNYISAKRRLRPFRDNPNVRDDWRNAERIARQRRPLARGLRLDLAGHNDAVTAVTHLAGQRIVVSGSADNTLRLWDTENGACVRTLEGHTNSVAAVSGSADGRMVFSASRDRTVRCWEVSTGRCLRTLDGAQSELTSLAVTRSGQRVLAGEQEGLLRYWDSATGACERVIKAHRAGVSSVALTAGGKYAFSGGPDGSIHRWDLENGTKVGELGGHEGAVTAIVLSDDGRVLITAGADKVLRMWHAASGTALRALTGHTAEVTTVAMSADGLFAISGSKDSSVRIWDLGHGRCLNTFIRHTKAVTGVGWRRDGRVASSGGDDGKVLIWQANDAETPFVATPVLCQAASSETLITQGQQFVSRLRAGVNALESGDALRAAREVRAAREQPGRRRSPDAVRIWQQLYVRLPRTFLRGIWEEALITQGDEPVRSIQLTRSGRYALVLRGSGTLNVWDLVDLRLVRTFDTGTHDIDCAAMSADGFDAVTGGWEIAMWDAHKGKPVVAFDSKGEVTSAIALSPDGLFAASAHAKSICIWDAQTGRLIRTLQGHAADVNALDWTFAGLVSGGADRRVVLWNPHTGAPAAVFEGHGGSVIAVATSPDGRRILSGTGSIWAREGELRLWDIPSQSCERELEGHADSVYSIGWSSDSRYAISGSGDQTAVLWDLNTGRKVHVLEAHSDSVFASCISADGRFALTGGKDGALRLWTLDWDLEEPAGGAYDDRATPLIEQFAAIKRAYSMRNEITRRLPDGDELPSLMFQLGCAGFGGLPQETVVEKLREIESRNTVLGVKRTKKRSFFRRR